MLQEVLGVGKDASFGIDENAFKTRDERRLAEQARNREQRTETAQLLKQLEVKEDRVEAHFEAKALESVGRPRAVSAPTEAVTPSGEASGLKAQELRP